MVVGEKKGEMFDDACATRLLEDLMNPGHYSTALGAVCRKLLHRIEVILSEKRPDVAERKD